MREKEQDEIIKKKIKPLEELNMADDYMFSAVLRDKTLCKPFIETILNIEIDRIEYIEPQKVLDIDYVAKGIRLDVYIKDDKGTRYNLEIQTSNKYDLLKRSRYYQAIIDLDTIQKGAHYNNLSKTYIIFICCFDSFNLGKFLYQFETVCTSLNSNEKLVNKKGINYTDDTIKLFFNTKGKKSNVSDEIQGLLKFIENSSDEVARQTNSRFIQQLNKKIKMIKVSEKARKEYMTQAIRDMDMKEEGRLEGIEQNKENNAIALLDILDDEIISEKIGLPLKRVKELRLENNQRK